MGLDVRSRCSSVINIDHHGTNTGFGDINLVDPRACAAGEMVHEVLKAAGWPVTPEIALNIFTALVVDTGNFSYSNTTPKALRVAARMVEAGARPEVVTENLRFNQPVERILCLARVLGTIGFSDDDRVAFVHVTNSMMEETGATKDHLDGFIEWPRSIRNVEVALFLKEVEEGSYKASLRSRGEVDVAALAGEFGGGGHPNAAGFSLDGNLDECREKILEALRRRLP